MDLYITIIKGGMREFERTGIYPEYLLFTLPGTRQNWRIRIKDTPQEGVLKSKGISVFEYSFDGKWCKFRKAKSDGSSTAWMEPEIMSFERRD